MFREHGLKLLIAPIVPWLLLPITEALAADTIQFSSTVQTETPASGKTGAISEQGVKQRKRPGRQTPKGESVKPPSPPSGPVPIPYPNRSVGPKR